MQRCATGERRMARETGRQRMTYAETEGENRRLGTAVYTEEWRADIRHEYEMVESDPA